MEMLQDSLYTLRTVHLTISLWQFPSISLADSKEIVSLMHWASSCCFSLQLCAYDSSSCRFGLHCARLTPLLVGAEMLSPDSGSLRNFLFSSCFFPHYFVPLTPSLKLASAVMTLFHSVVVMFYLQDPASVTNQTWSLSSLTPLNTG